MDDKTKALLVIATDPQIRRFLMRSDPKALEQVEGALGPDKPSAETFPATFAKDGPENYEVVIRKYVCLKGYSDRAVMAIDKAADEAGCRHALTVVEREMTAQEFHDFDHGNVIRVG